MYLFKSDNVPDENQNNNGDHFVLLMRKIIKKQFYAVIPRHITHELHIKTWLIIIVQVFTSNNA